MLSTKRLTPILFVVLSLFATLFFLGPHKTVLPTYRSPWPGSKAHESSEHQHQNHNHQQQHGGAAAKNNQPATANTGSVSQPPPPPSGPSPPSKSVAISYDKTTPPSVGCEDIVHDLQRRLIETYQKELKGIRYANVYGYLETENKGDAAIWSAQQILMSMMGIDFMEACRFTYKECDLPKFKAALDKHRPHSAILIAGGGNFNDFYWEDQPSRIQMVEMFSNVPVRSFPQSVHMTHTDRINLTKTAFAAHPDLQLAARDQPSFDWLDQTFGSQAVGIRKNAVRRILTPDIAFMWGNRPDFRLNTKKTHDILILARDDWEVSAGDSGSIPMGMGTLDLGGSVGNVTYNKVDWKSTKTPGINGDAGDGAAMETGKNQRAWAKAIEGFQLLGSAHLVITDRLHGHIMSTLIGTPHVLLDSKLGKNINFHNTWTRDCACTRVADNIDQAKRYAAMYFEAAHKKQAP